MEDNPKQVAAIMTRGVETVRPSDSLRDAARKMEDMNIGVLPVCDGTELIGVVTDRDMVVRGIARGAAPDRCTVAEVMTTDPEYSYEDESVDEATEKMAALRIRRLFVLDRGRRLVGVLSLGDVAVDSEVEPREMAETLKNISEPGRPERSV
jgi:CBS domain-containing protein